MCNYQRPRLTDLRESWESFTANDAARASLAASYGGVLAVRIPTTGEHGEETRGNWRLLRETVADFAKDADQQIADPHSEDAFDWEGPYPASWLSEEAGWISPQLREHLDALDALVSQLSDDKLAWSHEAIANHPLWHEVRARAREALELMPAEPWA